MDAEHRVVHAWRAEVGRRLRIGRRVAVAEAERATPEVDGARAAERVAVRLLRGDFV